MVNILKKYFSEKTQSTEFQSIIDSYTKLKQMTNNFEELINGEQITLNDEIFESFYNFLFAYAKISNLVEKEDFLNEVEKICTSKEIIFWDSIVLYFETVSHIREQTKFLREMSVTDFQDLMNYTFSCHIMHNNFVKSSQ